jgi:hypothetical protein
VLLSLFHRTRGNTALLEWRIGLFFLGVLLGLAGVFLDASWLVTTALIVLLGGVALRGLVGRNSGSEEQEPRPPGS